MGSREERVTPVFYPPMFKLIDKNNCNKMNSELIQNVIQWGYDKGIFEKATAIKQGEKTGEEYAEMMRALGKQELANKLGDLLSSEDHVEIVEEIEDAIGDQVVTLILQAHMQGTTIEKCLQGAYDIIAKRTGTMIDGKFVKDGK